MNLRDLKKHTKIIIELEAILCLTHKVGKATNPGHSANTIRIRRTVTSFASVVMSVVFIASAKRANQITANAKNGYNLMRISSVNYLLEIIVIASLRAQDFDALVRNINLMGVAMCEAADSFTAALDTLIIACRGLTPVLLEVGELGKHRHNWKTNRKYNWLNG